MLLTVPAIHEALVADPSLVFVQSSSGELSKLSCVSEELHVYPGSFNPLHDGHRAIFSAMPTSRSFEFSINRVGKEPVTAQELSLRLQQFAGYAPVLITNVAKFVEKAQVILNPKVVFHVGADTLTRLLEHLSNQELEGFRCSFVYYERAMNGVKVAIPTAMPRNCRPGPQIPERFLNLSSTALRNAGKGLA